MTIVQVGEIEGVVDVDAEMGEQQAIGFYRSGAVHTHRDRHALKLAEVGDSPGLFEGFINDEMIGITPEHGNRADLVVRCFTGKCARAGAGEMAEHRLQDGKLSLIALQHAHIVNETSASLRRRGPSCATAST